jgi:hypothetical protein
VLYSWSVDEHWRRARQETYTDDKGRTRTRTVIDTGSDTVASGGESGGFYIQDDTGYVWVNPEGADMDTLTMFERDVDRDDPLYYDKGPDDAVEGSTGERSFTEYGLVIGTPLFVRGRASERPDIVAAQIKHEDKADMFIITPRLVQALAQAPSVPTDNHVPPSRAEVYLNGALESSTPPPSPTPAPAPAPAPMALSPSMRARA